MTTTTIRVVLVDDDALVRAGLRLLLGGTGQIEIVGEARDGAEGIDAYLRWRPDVLLMDIRMPRLDGISATQQLLAREPDACVLMLTTFDTDDMILDALRAGARGFLLKDTPPEKFVDGVLAVAHGEQALSPSVVRLLLEGVRRSTPAEARGPARELTARLTGRERDVADAVSLGLSNAEIAASLHLGLPTVKAYVSRAMSKVGATNRVQLALLVRDAQT